jgi:hypothetical protein
MDTLRTEMSVGVLHDHFLEALATTNCDLMTKGWPIDPSLKPNTDWAANRVADRR